MREIDRELAHLARRMKAARVIDPAEQPDRSRVFFGATVNLVDEDDREKVLTLVGNDEAEASEGRIGWGSPMARALRGAEVGDVRMVKGPTGVREWEVLAITYPDSKSRAA